MQAHRPVEMPGELEGRPRQSLAGFLGAVGLCGESVAQGRAGRVVGRLSLQAYLELFHHPCGYVALLSPA